MPTEANYQNMDEPTCGQKVKRGCVKYCAIFFVVIFAVVWIWQGLAYWYGLNFSCSASSLEGYTYPGAEAGTKYTKEENLVPRIALLAEREASAYGASFDVIPSNDASSVSEAPVGVWWATSGPLFTTYIYEDVHASKTIVYMRRNLLRLGMSHRIGRCDGKGDDYTLYEGSFWFSNRVRKLFGVNQAFTFKLYDGKKLVGLVQETNKGTPSLTVADEEGKELGSGVLQMRHFHGDKDLWLTKTHPGSEIPFYVTDSITALFSFAMLGSKHKEAKKIQKDISEDDYYKDSRDAARSQLLLWAKDDASILANASEPAGELQTADNTLELNAMDAEKEKVQIEHV